MSWRDKLALLMGTAAPFAVTHDAVAQTSGQPVFSDGATPPEAHKDLLMFVDPGDRARMTLLASHSSHSSHASHASHGSGYGGHASHYSSSLYAAPIYSPPPPPPPVRAKKPAKAPKVQGFVSAPVVNDTTVNVDADQDAKPKKYTQDELSQIVMKVQVALIVRGYDPGPADGVLHDQTKAALSRFQADNKLTVTGAMDLPTLRLLNVVP